jgi:large subunit ribosomal protein L18
MKSGPRYQVKLRRRREHKTDYRKRLTLLKSRKPRVVVRNSLNHVRVQFVDYSVGGDKIIASAISQELQRDYKWKYSTSTTPAAYLTGLLAGKRALGKGIKEGVLDIGRSIPAKGSKNFAALKGVIDAGVKVPHDKEKLPSDDRITGKHLNKEIETTVNGCKEKIIGGK